MKKFLTFLNRKWKSISALLATALMLLTCVILPVSPVLLVNAAFEYPETIVDESGNKWTLVNADTGQYQNGMYLTWNDYYKKFMESPNYAHYVDTDGDGTPDTIMPLEENFFAFNFLFGYYADGVVSYYNGAYAIGAVDGDLGALIPCFSVNSDSVYVGVSYPSGDSYGYSMKLVDTIPSDYAYKVIKYCDVDKVYSDHSTYGDIYFIGSDGGYTSFVIGEDYEVSTDIHGYVNFFYPAIDFSGSGGSSSSSTSSIDKSPIWSDYQGLWNLSAIDGIVDGADWSNWWISNYTYFNFNESNSGYAEQLANLQLPVGLNIWDPSDTSTTAIPVYKLENMNYGYLHYKEDKNAESLTYKFDTIYFTLTQADVTLSGVNNAYYGWTQSVVEYGVVTGFITNMVNDITVPAGSVAITVLDSSQADTGLVVGYISPDGTFTARSNDVEILAYTSTNHTVDNTINLLNGQPDIAMEFNSMPLYFKAYDMKFSLSGTNTYTARDENYANQVMQSFLKLNGYTQQSLQTSVQVFKQLNDSIDAGYDKGYDDGLHSTLWTDLFVAPIKTVYELPLVTLKLPNDVDFTLTWGTAISIPIAISLLYIFIKLFAGG